MRPTKSILFSVLNRKVSTKGVNDWENVGNEKQMFTVSLRENEEWMIVISDVMILPRVFVSNKLTLSHRTKNICFFFSVFEQNNNVI